MIIFLTGVQRWKENRLYFSYFVSLIFQRLRVPWQAPFLQQALGVRTGWQSLSNLHNTGPGSILCPSEYGSPYMMFAGHLNCFEDHVLAAHVQPNPHHKLVLPCDLRALLRSSLLQSIAVH